MAHLITLHSWVNYNKFKISKHFRLIINNVTFKIIFYLLYYIFIDILCACFYNCISGISHVACNLQIIHILEIYEQNILLIGNQNQRSLETVYKSLTQ